MNEPWIYIILLGLVIIVYSRMQPQKASAAKSSAQVVEEVEASMNQVTIIMEEERQELLAYMATSKNETDQTLRLIQDKLSSLELQYDELSSKFVQLDQQSHAVTARLSVLAPSSVNIAKGLEQSIVIEDEDAHAEHDSGLLDLRRRYAELFALYREGRSAEAIAKKLQMHKAEVSLILQLARQEGDHV